jgi:hypothetical protein
MKKTKKKTDSDFIPAFHHSSRQRIFKGALLLGILVIGIYGWSLDPVNIQWDALFINAPVALRVFAPTNAQVGEEFEITLEAWDYCERLVCGYNREVSFNATDPAALLPGSYKFKPSGLNQGFIEAYRIPWGDQGFRTFNMTLNSPGIHYIIVEDTKGLVGWSNPIVVTTEAPEVRIYWGDIHGHTSGCDGSGYTHQVYYYAKNIACLDFAAVTLHDHFISAFGTSWTWGIRWDIVKGITDSWNQPNEFVTLQAYEYRGEFIDLDNNVGDVCVYSRGEVPFFSGVDRDYCTPDLLFAALGEWKNQTGIPVMCIPHHPAKAMAGLTYDWSYFNPEFIRLVEVYSVHGSSEMSSVNGNRFPLLGGMRDEIHNDEINKSGYYINEALAMGYQIGLMASGDAHDGHLGHSISHTDANHLLQPPYTWDGLPHLFRNHHHYPNGLVAIYCPSALTRENVFDSLWNRSCYATKGVGRTYVNFTINGYGVGYNESILQVPSNATTRDIRLTVAAGGGDPSNMIERVQIIKNNQIWQDIACYNRTASFEWADTEIITGLSYNASLLIERDGEYYITEEADNPCDPSSLNTNGADVYYAKVYETGGPVYENDEGVAWIGPLWVQPPIQ